jgi:NNP family nitrate/nitrite transporter-like MFS transporter
MESNRAAQRRGLACACAAGFAFSANYTNHAPLVPALTAEFHFNLARAGLLTTGIFLTHAALQIPGGHLADRLGSRRVLTVALAVVCAGNFAIGFAAAYWQLLFWKIFVGVGTGTCFVAGARYLAGLVSGPLLHVAQGLYGGSILLGSGFVILAVPQFLAALGWRGAFFATAGIAAAAWLAWTVLAPRPPVEAHPPGSFRDMLSNPELWLLGIAQMASFGLVIVVGAWIPTFLRTLNLSLQRAGLVGSLVLLLGIVTRPLGGILAPRLGARRLLWASLILNAAACLLLGVGARSTIAILMLGLGCGLPYAALFTRASKMYPGRAGAARGLVNMLGILMILAAPPLIGHLVDWTGSFRSSFLALSAFELLACAAVLGIKNEPHRPV